MNLRSVRVSLVVSTVNRSAELTRLLDSLLAQDFKDFEVIVVDQNCDDRIVLFLERYQSDLNIRRVSKPRRTGVSAGRNDGWRQARGEVIVFPDDDCWYPPWFLRKGLELLDKTGAEIVSGRSADEGGRSINGRFASYPLYVSRRSVWIAQAEWTTFFGREELERLGGFDENLGIGSSTPWQAAEGPDLILNALERGHACYYDPSLYGFHRKYDLDNPVEGMTRKGRIYGRGMGYVLRRHGYGVVSLLQWASRPLVTASISTIRGRFQRTRYSLSVTLGRIEGWTGHLWTIGMRPSVVPRGAGRMIDGSAITSTVARRDLDSSASFGTKRREMTGPYRARNRVFVATLHTVDALASLLPKRTGEFSDDRPLRVLVANWGHLGDVVTILPLLKFLELHPRVGELGVMVGSWSRSVMESSDISARLHLVDHWVLDRSSKSTLRKIVQYFARYASVVRELRRCRYDLSIDTFASFPSSHGITWGASIPRRSGFTSGGLGPCLTDPFDWTPDNRLMLDQQLELLKPLLGELHPKSLPASYPGFECMAPDHPLGIGNTPYIVIHMGPQDIKGWVPERWISLAAALIGQGYELVVTGGPGREMEVARDLREKIGVRDLTGQLSWAQFVATVAHSAAVVTIDSVAGHLAACFGVPAVILTTGRTRLNLWRPNSSDAIALTHQVGCAPCHRTRGCAAMACVRLIDVGDVLSSLQQLIKLKDNGLSEDSKPITISVPN
jgi:ADP-heptose:LPS heptosyltransferase/glycosyltransferase involved in cell wall biosynthesis